MNQFFKHKILSFTLAEMMVVLALFSVISAATMPVITARQQLEGASSTSGGVEGEIEDPWVKYEDHNVLSYYNETQPKDSAVMVGNNVSSSSVDLGKPRLIITDGFGTGPNGQNDASHIALFKDVAGTPYYTGRIMMGNNSSQSIGSVALGASALAYHSNSTSRFYNVAIGSNAMATQDSDSSGNKIRSVGVGANTMFGSGVSANNSTAIGYNALNLSSSDGSVAIGSNAGSSSSKTNSQFNKSVAIGYNAMSSGSGAVSANYSVAIGAYANVRTRLDNSTAIGYYAGYNTSKSGSNFVAIGTRALSDTSGDGESVAIGNYAGYKSGNNKKNNFVTIGAYAGNGAWFEEGSAVFIGTFAGNHQAETNNTVAIGMQAGNMYAITTGDANFDKGPVFIGVDAGHRHSSEATGDTHFAPSVSLGYQAGSYYNMGVSAYSILVGAHSGMDTSVSDSVCIGAYACSGTRNNFIQGPSIVRISSKNGYWQRTNGDNISLIGDVPDGIRTASLNSGKDQLIITPLYGSLEPNSSVNSSIVFFGDVFSAKTSFSTFSDKRLKENIKPAKYGLNEIRKINVYSYNWKQGDTKTPQIGVIAQEVQKIIPESVHIDKDKAFNGYLTVDSSWFLFSMVNAIKDLDSQVLAIKNKFVAYSKEYISLVQRVNKLEKEVKVLEKENKTLIRDVKVAYTKVKKAERR